MTDVKKITKRRELIEKLEARRNSRVLVYITGDRSPMTTQVADDALMILFKHLETFGETDRISLFLATRGGDRTTAWRIIKLLRRYAEDIEIIIPFRAHGAGTLIALGGDRIFMTKFAELTPIDIKVEAGENLPNISRDNQQNKINLAEIESYFSLARNRLGNSDQVMAEVFKGLVNKIHPLALGNLYRSCLITKQLISKLLHTHMGDSQKDIIERIAKNLVEGVDIPKSTLHRDEAQDLELKVEFPEEDFEEEIIELTKEYIDVMKLNSAFDPFEILGENAVADFKCPASYIESTEITDSFVYKGRVFRLDTEERESPQVDLQVHHTDWVEVFRGGTKDGSSQD